MKFRPRQQRAQSAFAEHCQAIALQRKGGFNLAAQIGNRIGLVSICESQIAPAEAIGAGGEGINVGDDQLLLMRLIMLAALRKVVTS